MFQLFCIPEFHAIAWHTLFYSCESCKDFRGIQFYTLNWFCWLNLLHTAKALSFPHKLPPFSSLLPLCYQNSHVYLFFMPKALCPLFSRSCFPITAIKNFPRNIWHWSEIMAVLHDREASESSVPSCASPGGNRDCRGAICIWAGLVNCRNNMESLWKMKIWKAWEMHDIQSYVDFSQFCVFSIIILYLNISLSFFTLLWKPIFLCFSTVPPWFQHSWKLGLVNSSTDGYG